MGSQAFEAPREQIFMLDADKDVVIIGLDTEDGPEHILYDAERINLPLDEDLVENIDFLGKVLEPVGVRKNGDQAEIIFGSMRTRAVREVNKRRRAAGRKDFIRLPARIDRADESQLIARMYSENAQRRVDAPMARARHINRYLEQGNSAESAKKIFRLSVQSIKAQLALLDLDKSVQKMVDRGELPATAAATLSGLTRDEQKAAAEKLIGSGTATVASAKTEVKRSKATKRGGSAEDVVTAPTKRELRRVVEANAKLDEGDQLEAEFIRGIRFALGDLSPGSIKGLTAMMAPPVKEAAE